MSNDQSRTVMQVMNEIEGVRLKEKHGGKFHFRFHMTEKMNELPIEVLDLSTRAHNGIKRRGFNTIGDLVNSIAAGNDIRQTRSLGPKSAREIISDFVDRSNELLDKYFPDSYLFKQNSHSVSSYLFLNDPENHYMYKATQCRDFADCVE